MSEVTIEYLDQKFGNIETRFEKLETKFDHIETRIDDLKSYVDQQNQELKRELKGFVLEQNEELAQMVARGFEEIKHELDVHDQVTDLNKRMTRIEQVLDVRS